MAAMDGLGAALMSLRKERGLTQTELAQQAQVTRGNLSLYESGKTQPRLDTLNRILEVLDVDLMLLAQRMKEVLGLDFPEGVGKWKADRTAFLVVPLRRQSLEEDDDASAMVELGSQYAARIVEELFPRKTKREVPEELGAEKEDENREHEREKESENRVESEDA